MTISTKPRSLVHRSGSLRPCLVGSPAFWRHLNKHCKGRELDDTAREKIERIARFMRGEAAAYRDSRPGKIVARELDSMRSKVVALEEAFYKMSNQADLALETYLIYCERQQRLPLQRTELERALFILRSSLHHAARDLRDEHRPDDINLLKRYLPDLRDVYEQVTESKIGVSKASGSSPTGPFVRFVKVFVAGVGAQTRRGRQRDRRSRKGRFIPANIGKAIDNWLEDQRRLPKSL